MEVGTAPTGEQRRFAFEADATTRLVEFARMVLATAALHVTGGVDTSTMIADVNGGRARVGADASTNANVEAGALSVGVDVRSHRA